MNAMTHAKAAPAYAHSYAHDVADPDVRDWRAGIASVEKELPRRRSPGRS